MNKHEQRNEEIVARYQAGEPILKLRAAYNLSAGRIYQILGAVEKKRKQPTKIPRDVFLGINVSESVKDALLVEANRRGISMSSLSSEALKQMLIDCGYTLEAESL
jgi:hypothetical protein